jgi:hypothetical protein
MSGRVARALETFSASVTIASAKVVAQLEHFLLQISEPWTGGPR